MKKLFILFMLLSNLVQAQPVFAYLYHGPKTVMNYTVGRASAVSAGPSGASQTWNFSGAAILSNVTYTVDTASTVPCYNDYPSAAKAIGASGAFDMINSGMYEYYYFGTTITPSMSDVVYTDPKTNFHYPMFYLNNYSDTYYGNNTSGLYRYGYQTVTYDGYGTLITPYATYSNAMRIHISVNETDSTGGAVICNATRDYYYWFDDAKRYPVAKIWNSSGSCSFSAGAEFLQDENGVDEHESKKIIAVYPTLVNDALFVKNTDGFQLDPITISDVNGKITRTIYPISNEMQIDLFDLENGIYYVAVSGTHTRIVKM